MDSSSVSTTKPNQSKRRTRFANQSFRRLVKEFNDVGLSFSDDRFKSCDKSVALSPHYRSRLDVGKIVWQRPSELCRASDDLNSSFRSSSRTDDGQDRKVTPRLVPANSEEQFWAGSGPNGWLIAACQSICQHRSLLRQIVNLDEDCFQKYGIVKFNLWQFGSWQKVVVDDKLPCSDSKLVFSRPSSLTAGPAAPCFWLPLLEKAFAKLYGSYEMLAQKSSLSSVWIDLTGGGVVDTVLLSDVPNHQNQDSDSSSCSNVVVPNATPSLTTTTTTAYHDQLIQKEFAAKSLLLLKTKDQTSDPFGLTPNRYYLVKNVKKPMGTLKRTLKRTGNSLAAAATASPSFTPKLDHSSVTSIQLLNTMLPDSSDHSSSNRTTSNKPAKLQELWVSIGELGKHFESLSICRPYQYNKDRIAREFGHASTTEGSSQFYFDLRNECGNHDQVSAFASAAPIELLVCLIQKGTSFVPLGFRLYWVELNRRYRVHSFESLQLVYSADPVNQRNRIERVPLPSTGWPGSATCRLLLVPICNHHTTVPLLLQLYSNRARVQSLGQLSLDNPRYDQWFNLLPPRYPVCVSRVVVHGAIELPKQDRFGSANPFCIVRCGKQAVKSSFQYETLSPSWHNFAAIFYHKRKVMPIQIELWHRTLLVNHFIGMVQLQPKPIKATTPFNQYGSIPNPKKQLNGDGQLDSVPTESCLKTHSSLQAESLTDNKGVPIASGKVSFQLITFEDLKHF